MEAVMDVQPQMPFFSASSSTKATIARTRRSARVVVLTLGALALTLALRGAAFAVAGGAMAPQRPATTELGSVATLAAGRTAPVVRGDSALLAREAGASWLPALPQTCSDDFECNDGKANFPLQCCEVMMMRFCCEPDDFMPATDRPAYVPIPVPVDTPYD
mmetsp:Transcript_3113/g.7012  ORF Transcript_3113/g.7012 Transcript_3113/m.7012 type:complete len:161 (+) Transcript_3113:97-579(+)|eukprot:CAMPEP_0178386160 /NCGR_PEP_ID=MMETSP0689_2-20121128/8415_1 /TAXON_ID=160604 /ORGANISM="Amphidinium massartii, Strain CS-259" /LENGTH=160 /DNA_ID=CAMNT_0020006485 /DNA_START=97 /DNA_END=579 /DNA_ORIENTATION=+